MTELADASPFFDALRQEDLFPIREVSRVTGVNPVTLRAWERRYGLIQPTRTDSGHRLYSATDIETVRSILAWIERGVAVSKVGKILARQDERNVPAEPEDGTRNNEWAEWQAHTARAVAAFDAVQLDRLYGQVFASYSLAVVFERIFMPLWQDLLLRRDAFGQTSEWLFLDSFLRARVSQRLQLAAGGPGSVLLSAWPGHCHELELLIAGLLLAGEGGQLQVLAYGQPMAELTLVCDKVQPPVLVLFSNKPTDEAAKQLTRLALTLPCPLLVAGEAAELLQDELAGSPVACLGNEGSLMRSRLQQFLAGRLDS